MKLKVALLFVLFSFFNLQTYSQGQGLTGHYFQDSYAFNIENNTWQNCMDLEFASWCPPTEDITWFETYMGSRVDSLIEVRMGDLDDFLADAPGELNPELPVSIRWEGYIKFEHAEDYLLHLGGADGLRLNIGGENLVGTFLNTGGSSDPGWLVRPYLAWETPDYTPKTVVYPVTEEMVGKKIPILIEFYSIGVTQWSSLDVRGITLEWESTSQEKEIVPTSQLYPAEAGDGLRGYYYQDSYAFNIENNTWQNCMDLEFASWCPPTEDITWFETYMGSRVDSLIEVRMGDLGDFLADAPGELNPELPVSIRWEGYIKFEHAEDYLLHLGGSDGLRLNIGGDNLVGTFLNTGGSSDPGWLVRPYLAWETPDYTPKTVVYSVTGDMIGKKIPILIEFYSIGVTQWSSIDVRGITLEWESTSQEKEIVPTSQLFASALKQEVTFTVTDGTNSLAGAEITIDGMDPFTTDENGVASVLLESGDYIYAVSAEGYEDVTDAAFAVDDAEVAEDVVLEFETSISQWEDESVLIYPNPANDQLNIQLAHNSSDTYSIKMTSITGSVVKYCSSSENFITIDVRDFSKGIYFISISNSKETIVKKVIVE